jgi:hypothetical protein
MFETDINNITDVGRIRKRIQQYPKKRQFGFSNMEYEYLSELSRRIKVINYKLTKDWKKLTCGKQKPHAIHDTTLTTNQKSILLQLVTEYKHKWTGPWTIHKISNDRTLIIFENKHKIIQTCII